VTNLSRHPLMAEPLRDLIALARRLGGARYFKPVGGSMVVLTADSKVWPSGEGFVDGLAAYQNADAEGFLRIIKSLNHFFPHIRTVRILREERTRHLVFETSRSTRLTPAELEADGVLTTLFLPARGSDRARRHPAFRAVESLG